MVEQTHINIFISVLSSFIYVYAQNMLVSEIERVKCWTSGAWVCCKCSGVSTHIPVSVIREQQLLLHMYTDYGTWAASIIVCSTCLYIK